MSGGYSVPWELRLVGKTLDEAVRMWGVYFPYPNNSKEIERFIPIKRSELDIDYHVRAGMKSEKNGGVNVIFSPSLLSKV
jgi:hypothetical protein